MPYIHPWRRLLPRLVVACTFAGWPAPLWAAPYDGKLTITTLDEKSREPLAVRMELRDGRGRPVRVRPEGAVAVGDSLYFDGEVTLPLRRGAYTFLIEAGPEFITRPGNFTIDRRAEDSTEVTLGRRVDMRAEGWWAGDLDLLASPADLPLMMRSRSLDFAPYTTLVNEDGRCRKAKLGAGESESAVAPIFGPWAVLDNRRGGGLLAIAADAPINVCGWKADEPSLPMAIASREAGGRVVALTPDAWDLPLWVAAGKLDAVAIINRHSLASAVVDGEANGRPRDKDLFPGHIGNGRYGESIYHHLLNCGLRLPPAAGSGFGAIGKRGSRPSPDQSWSGLLGANRAYVHCGETCDRDAWLAALKAGRVIVTNGPLLRTSIDGEPPGHVFELQAGERREFQIALDLAFYAETQVEYLEIVQNGRTLHQVRLDELAANKGRLPFVEFDDSGWFLVRAVTNNPKVYQFASTGPYYVEQDYKQRISRASVQYFLDWLDDAAKQFAANAAVVSEIEAARPFWEGLLAKANAQ